MRKISYLHFNEQEQCSMSNPCIHYNLGVKVIQFCTNKPQHILNALPENNTPKTSGYRRGCIHILCANVYYHRYFSKGNLNKEENKQITWWFDSKKIIYVSMTASFISFSTCQTINITFNLV